jgi:hypothetical protein
MRAILKAIKSGTLSQMPWTDLPFGLSRACSLEHNSKTDVRFGSKVDICAATSHVRFTPNSDQKSGHPLKVMSALLPKADMCSALAHVCFGPKADIER